MQKSKNLTITALDTDEEEMMRSFNAGEWDKVSKANFSETKEAFKSAEIQKADKKQITIKLGKGDIDVVKRKASETGISYQNIISALVHNYAVGRIKLEI